MCTESKTVPNVGKIGGQKLWYIRRHRPVPCPAADCFFPKQMLPGSRSLPGSESLHLPSGSAFTSARCGSCPTRNFAHHGNYCRLHLSSSELSVWQNSGHAVALVQRGHHVSSIAVPSLTDRTQVSESRSPHSQSWVR